jgi:hypothetical protein
MSERSGLRLGGGLVLFAGIVTATLNLLLPRANAENDYLAKIATSNTWSFLHAGLIIGVISLLVGLLILLRSLSDRARLWRDIAFGAISAGGTVLLLALAVSAAALRKRADAWLPTGDPSTDPFNIPTFLSAETVDHVTWAMYGLAALLLLGLMPLAVGVVLRGNGGYPGWLSWLSGVVGLAGIGLGLVQLTAELDTSTAYLVVSIAVIIWTLCLGALMFQRGSRVSAA